MKAYILKAPGQLVYEETERPACPDGWAIVKVKAAGICSSDIPRIFVKGTYHFPTIPGHEFSGIVEEVGSDRDEDWVGRRVSVFPLIPCRDCDPCREGHYEMCAHYDYVGSRRDGGFAQYVAVPVWNLIELENGVSYRAAAMMEPLSVALHAVKQSGQKRDDTVCVIGTGMIGIAIGLWAKSRGARKVVIVGRNDTKRSLVEQAGLLYETEGQLSEMFDVVFEAVGSEQSVCRAISAVKPGKTLLVMGNPAGDIHIPQDIWWRILRKQLHVIGTWNSSYESGIPCDWSEAEQALGRGEIPVENLISHTFSQDQVMDGLKLMRDHKEPYCKVMTIWNEEEI